MDWTPLSLTNPILPTYMDLVSFMEKLGIRREPAPLIWKESLEETSILGIY